MHLSKTLLPIENHHEQQHPIPSLSFAIPRHKYSCKTAYLAHHSRNHSYVVQVFEVQAVDVTTLQEHLCYLLSSHAVRIIRFGFAHINLIRLIYPQKRVDHGNLEEDSGVRSKIWQ